MSMLERLEAAMVGGASAIQNILRDVEFPRVEGRNVTFLFQGEAQEVTLHHWIHGLPGELQFLRLRQSDRRSGIGLQVNRHRRQPWPHHVPRSAAL